MKARELKEMTREQLSAELENAYRELFNLRFRASTRQLDDTSALGRARKDIARIRTVLREKELAEEKPAYEG